MGFRNGGMGFDLRKKVKRFRGGLVFKDHRRVYHSTLGGRAIRKKKKYRIQN